MQYSRLKLFNVLYGRLQSFVGIFNRLQLFSHLQAFAVGIVFMGVHDY